MKLCWFHLHKWREWDEFLTLKVRTCEHCYLSQWRRKGDGTKIADLVRTLKNLLATNQR